MAIKENGIITMMRGDSFETPIYINIGTHLEPVFYSLTERDRLYIGVMEPNMAFEDAVLKKVYTSSSPKDKEGNTLFILEPKDTQRLLVGKYYYMIKLRSFDDEGREKVKTILQPTLFWIDGNNPDLKKWEDDYYEQDEYDIEEVHFEGEKLSNVIKGC